MRYQITVQLSSTGGQSVTDNNSYSYYLKIGNTVVVDGGFKIGTIADGGSKTIVSGDTLITHDADGSYATKTVTFRGAGYQGQPASSSANTITIPLIDRVSVPTLSVSSLVADGTNSVKITTNSASSSLTHTITYACAGGSGTIGTGIINSKT